MSVSSEPADSLPTRPSYAEQPPTLLGGTLCLDFVNTANRARDPAHPVERLTGYRELLYWAAAAGVLDGETAGELADAAAADPESAAAALRDAVALREALARLFQAPAGGDPSDLELVNRLLARAPERRQLAPAPGRYVWRSERVEQDLRRPLWPVLWDAAALLASDRLPLVRCCGADDCRWLFLDQTRNRSRRWCSMEECGNRAKARRHYAKRKRSG